MTATLLVHLRPFTVPNFVIEQVQPGSRSDVLKEAPSHPLSALSAETLDRMCADFRAAVFAKAGRLDPASTKGA